MLFNSLQYMIFLPLIAGLFYLTPPRHRWVLLLAASYYFYMCWRVEYIVLIVASTLIDYFASLRMASLPDKRQRRKYLLLSICTNLGLLFAFKYFNFASESFHQLARQFNIFYEQPILNVLLPVGISFYTFQTLSYTISVYRGTHPPERHLGLFALFVSFFPQLVAGPIERSTNLLPQFRTVQHFDYDRVISGLRLIVWGMFKKVVIADRVAVLVDNVYNQPHAFGGAQLLVATVFFAFQIYCDFSGYSDMAIGSAQVLDFKLMQNFDRPYFSKSITEFWGRWHISLSTWFRDYLYIPLGGNRVAKWRWYVNLFLTFLISGLWHGANWTFLFWGGLNGLYLIAETLTSGVKARSLQLMRLTEASWAYKIPSVALTFTLTCIAWVFFRANSMSDGIFITSQLGSGLVDITRVVVDFDMIGLDGIFRGLGISRRELIIAISAIGVMEIVHFMQRGHNLGERVSNSPTWVRWSLYYAIVICIVFFGSFNQSQQFIYFQF